MLLSITVNPWFVCILVDVTTFGLFRFGDGVVGGGVIGGEGVGAGAGDGADVVGGDGVDEGGQEGPWKFSGSLDYSSSIEYTHTPEKFQVPWKFPGPEKIQGPWKFSGSLEISSSPGNFQGGSLIHIGRAVQKDPTQTMDGPQMMTCPPSLITDCGVWVLFTDTGRTLLPQSDRGALLN